MHSAISTQDDPPPDEVALVDADLGSADDSAAPLHVVRPASRGQGLGRARVRTFEQHARTQGSRTFMLEIFSFEAPACFLDGLGWVRRFAWAGPGDEALGRALVRRVQPRRQPDRVRAGPATGPCRSGLKPLA